MASMVRQRGAALAVSLVLLTVALILGLSSVQSSRLEEQMAGNYRASASALMAAEYGGSEAWKIFLTGAPNCGGGDWPAGDQMIAAAEVDAAYSIGCAQKVDASGAPLFGRYVISSMGKVNLNDPVERNLQYETHLGVGPGAPINSTGCDNLTFVPPSSNAEVTGEEDVDGNNRAAFQTGCMSDAQHVVSEVIPNNSTIEESATLDGDTYGCIDGNGNNRLCNYEGGVKGSMDVEILKDPNLLAEFLLALKNDGTGVVTTTSSFPTTSEFEAAGNGVFFVTHGDDPESQGVATDVNGRPTFTHSGNLQGSGILVVDGSVDFNGVPSFDGLIIVLGDYVVSGGGGGVFNGSIVASPIDRNEIVDGVDYTATGGNELDCGEVCVFADKTVEIGGGGSSSYNFDDEVLLDAFASVQNITIGVDNDGDGVDDEDVSIIDLWGLEGEGLGNNYYIATWQEEI